MKGHKADPSAQKRSAGLSPSAARLLAEAGVSLGRGQSDDAERALIGVLALAPASAEANRLMGIAAQMRGQHAASVDFLHQALASCPDDATILMNLGSSLYESGSMDAALSALRRACDLAPYMAAERR